MIIEHINCLIVSSTNSDFTTFEAIIGDLGTKSLATLPSLSLGSLVMHSGSMLLCGGTDNEQKCFQLCHGLWKEHSDLNERRIRHAATAITTKIATFIFGGYSGYGPTTTYEYLPKDSNIWLMGKTDIPGDGFVLGCAIAVKSEQEIWLMGDINDGKRIISFNVNDHTFRVLPYELNVGTVGSRCAFIPNTNKVMITGGMDEWYTSSTEILDTSNESITVTSQMNSRRAHHGIGVITVNGEDRLAVFGGKSDDDTELDSIERYNTQTEEWETTNIKLQTPNCDFEFLSLNLQDVISKL